MNETASILLTQPLRFAQGFLLPFRGLRMMLTKKEIGGRALLLAFLGGAILVALAVLLFLFAGDLLSLLWPRPEGGAWLVLWYPAAVLTGAILFLVGAAVFPPLLLGGLLDSLSVATERQLGSTPPEEGGMAAMVKETARSIWKAVLQGAILLLGHGVLLLLLLVPVAGPALWPILSAIWTLFWLTCEYLDIAANRHGYSLFQVVRVVAKNPGASLGFGVAAYLLLWIPLLNLALIPFAVVGATILFVELRQSGQMQSAAKKER